MVTSSRFDLEQRIMEAWNIIEDLKTLNEGVLEHDMSKDEISNVLMGLETLYQLKFDKLFTTFEKMIQEDYKKRVDW